MWGRAARLRTLALIGVGAVAVGLADPTPALAASNWMVGLAGASSGQALSQPAPAAPSSVTAACVGLLSGQITVSWSAVPKATSYTVYDSTTAATGPYSVIATGVSASPWTSNVLATANYWFEVKANIGSNWSSAFSAATAQRGILLSLACG
jgi:hypothetical protein